MKRRVYLLASRLSAGVAVFALLGILITVIAGAVKGSRGGSSGSSLRGPELGGTDESGDVFAPAPGPPTPRPPAPKGPTGDPNRWYPEGPYVPFGQGTATVVLPEPDVPMIVNPRTNCPWEDTTNLVSWHDAATWGDSGVPSDLQEDVTLPAGKRVVIRESLTVELGIVNIPSDSELIFQEPPNGDKPLEMHVRGFVVRGRMILGSETCPIETPLTITLHGARPNNVRYESVDPSYKGIHVRAEGELQVHGKRFFHTWTRLARTVDPDEEPNAANVLMLQQSVNWEPGQEVVVLTSALKDSREWHQNEVRTIDEVHPNPPEGVGAVVFLTEPLNHRHVGSKNYQIEVALLTRVIRIEGAEDDSDPADPDPLDCVLPYKHYTWDGWMMLSQCPNTETTGYGGHIMVEGFAQVEGVELYRMGQTNVLARYPMHFHLIGDCPECYFKHSAIHRSYYRCATIHGTNSTLVTENVAYNIIGYCYYLEDGVEMENTISHNLGAHIHYLGEKPAWVDNGQSPEPFVTSEHLALPADATASPFYITNVHNTIVGNAASGGWSGFHFVNLKTPLETFRDADIYPGSLLEIKIDGNTAHSTAFWWEQAGAFYVGGGLEYNQDNELVYQAGRGPYRDPCLVHKPLDACKYEEFGWINVTNSKVFLLAGIGFQSWSGRFNVDGFEAHDTGMIVQGLARGFWMNNLYHACRSGESVIAPPDFLSNLWDGSSIRWYDTGQEHIVTNTVFRNCGLRAYPEGWKPDDQGVMVFDQYDSSPTRGCIGDDFMNPNGCDPARSTVWKTGVTADEMVPEIMQATKNITYIDCGRRFQVSRVNSVSARAQNWIDADGTASGTGVPTFMVPAIPEARNWWAADNDVGDYDRQGPFFFINKNDGPHRNLAHAFIRWDDSLHSRVGQDSYCDVKNQNCPILGWIRHVGRKYFPDPNNQKTWGLQLTASSEITGLTGGYGWFLHWVDRAPKTVSFERLEIFPDSSLMISMPYPQGTTFKITVSAGGCRANAKYSCLQEFQQTNDIEEVRRLGNKYHLSSSGVLTIRLVQPDDDNVGDPDWFIPGWDTLERNGWLPALNRFEREGIKLPWASYRPKITVEATCAGSGTYCSGSFDKDYNPDVCPSGYTQTGFDRCCRDNECKYPGDV